MKKIDIKGKDYVPVNERILYFRTADEFKDWAYLTEIVKDIDGIVRMCTTVYNPDGVPKSNGYAEEKENSTFINKTSFVENCETSSIGRALGNLGIGIDTSLASFEEVANAITNQNKKIDQPKQYTPKPIDSLPTSSGYKQENHAIDDSTRIGLEKILASLDKPDNATYKRTVLSTICKEQGVDGFMDIKFTKEFTYKILITRVLDLIAELKKLEVK